MAAVSGLVLFHQGRTEKGARLRAAERARARATEHWEDGKERRGSVPSGVSGGGRKDGDALGSSPSNVFSARRLPCRSGRGAAIQEGWQKPSYVDYGVYSTQNCRSSMEDVHSVYLGKRHSRDQITRSASLVALCRALSDRVLADPDLLPLEPASSASEGDDDDGQQSSFTSRGSALDLVGDHLSLFAVYDGHGGSRAAQFASDQIPLLLAEDPEALLERSEEALRRAMLRTEQRWLASAQANDWDDGTTAAIALVDMLNRRCTVGNVGDSEVVLATRTRGREEFEVSVLTEVHTPERNAKERARIVQSGGKLYQGRVGNPDPSLQPRIGSLAVSRSIGDLYFKDASRTSGRRSGLTAEPHLVAVDISQADVVEQFMIVACDGLWDVVNYDEAVQLVSKDLQSGCDLNRICEHLAELAKQLCSTDNITVVVVSLVGA